MATKTVPITITAATAVIAGVVGVLQLTGTFTSEDTGPDAGAPPPPPEADAAPPPPPPPPGSVEVAITLKPLATGNQWVTFGLPMPAGILTSVAQLRVRYTGGVEIPVFVRSLGDWRRVPPIEQLCTTQPSVPGIRSVLIQFQRNFTNLADVPITVELGVDGARLTSGTNVRATYRTVDDAGQLYNGTEGYKEPGVYALIDHKWLACTGLGVMAGQSDQRNELLATDVAERNFFYTSIADYRTVWTAPTSDWPVNAGNGPDMASAEDGVWLYQRAQTFWGGYLRNGLFHELRSGFQAFDHYRSKIYSAADCVGATNLNWCQGFFKLKNPDRNTPYKDPKYSYAEDFATYYWLTGDETALPYFDWIAGAQRIGVPNVGWTERYAAYQLMAPTIHYEVMGDQASKDEANAIVTGLVTRSNKASTDGHVSGCIIGNNEWGPDGFSPWMGPMAMTQLVRYYIATGDNRVTTLLAKMAQCILARGMTHTSAIQGVNRLIPFYGATTVGTLRDLDGDNPWAGIEHAINVAQGLSIGYLYETDSAKKTALATAIGELVLSGEWAFTNWTRTTAGLPKFRLAPWRKFNWWFHHAGQIQWARYARPTL